MTVPSVGTAPLDNPDHRAEHDRIAAQLRDDLPRGIVNYNLGTFTAAAVGSTPLAIFTLSSVSLLAGRLYLFAFTVRALQYNIQTNFNFTLTAAPYKHCSLAMDIWTANLASATHDHLYWEMPFTVDSDVVIPTIMVQVVSGNGAIWTDNCFALIRDIGPNRGLI